MWETADPGEMGKQLAGFGLQAIVARDDCDACYLL